MKPPGRDNAASALALLILTVPLQAQSGWIEPQISHAKIDPYKLAQQEEIKRLSPDKDTHGTLASLSHGILALRHLPESASNYSGGMSQAIFIPLTLAQGQRAFDPQMLPDASGVLFKVAGQDGAFHLYRYRIKQVGLQRLTKEPLQFDRVETAPDARALAFVRGFNGEGQPTAPGNGQLIVLDLNTGTELVAARSDALGWGGWAWLKGDLVFTAKTENETHPSLYAVTPGSQPQILAKAAWRPLPSPDNKQIAFFGAESVAEPSPLSARWGQNPRGAFVSVMDSDGSKRRALWRQDGAYPLLQWNGAQLSTLKNRKWIPDLGDHPIDRFDPLRADEYKGGLFGVLSLDGGWRKIARLARETSIPDWDAYQVYPTPDVDYDFRALGRAGDGSREYFMQRRTERQPTGTKTLDVLFARKGERQFLTIAEFEGGDGLDFHDETGPDAIGTGIQPIIDAPRLADQAKYDALQAYRAAQVPKIAAAMEALKRALPPQGETRRQLFASLEAKIGGPVATPPLPDDAWTWLKMRTAELFPPTDKSAPTDKALRDKNSLILAGEALRVAEQMLATNDEKKRQQGYDLARLMAETRVRNERDLLRGVLLGFLYPDIERAQANAQLVPTLNNLIGGLERDPDLVILVRRLQVEGGAWLQQADDYRFDLAFTLSAAGHFDEAIAVLGQISTPDYADRVTKSKELIKRERAAKVPRP